MLPERDVGAVHYCPNCGHPNTQGRFCGSCGASLTPTPAVTPAPSVSPVPIVARAGTRNKRIAFASAAAVLIVLSIAYAIWSLVTMGSTPVPVPIQAVQTQKIVSADKTVSMRIPGGWTQRKDTDLALRAEDGQNALTIMVNAGPLAESAKDSEVSELAGTAVRNFAQAMDLAVEGTPTPTTVRGNESVAYELSGTTQGRPVLAIHMTVRTSSHIVVMAAFGPADAFEAQRTKIVEALRTLKLPDKS
jgi:hypothetical protein